MSSSPVWDDYSSIKCFLCLTLSSTHILLFNSSFENVSKRSQVWKIRPFSHAFPFFFFFYTQTAETAEMWRFFYVVFLCWCLNDSKAFRIGCDILYDLWFLIFFYTRILFASIRRTLNCRIYNSWFRIQIQSTFFSRLHLPSKIMTVT